MTPDKAHMIDIPRALALFDQARQAMVASGNPDQWPPTYPALADLIDDILKDRAYVLRYHEDLAGMVSVVLGPYPLYEIAPKATWLNSDPYASLHRVCVNPSLTQKGIGGTLLSFGEAVALAHGYDNVRIHTHEKNLPMQKLLAKHAYQACGLIPGRDGRDRLAYHKTLSLSIPPDRPTLSDAFALAALPRGFAFQSQEKTDLGA